MYLVVYMSLKKNNFDVPGNNVLWRESKYSERLVIQTWVKN